MACAVIVAVPVGVARVAPIRIVVDVLVLVAICSGMAGLVATPDGRPESVTSTVPVKLFFGAMEIVADWGTPAWVSVNVAGVMETVKSGVEVEVGGGVALGASCDVVPPPQAVMSEIADSTIGIRNETDLRTAVPLRWVDGSRRGTIQKYLFICQLDK